jgi:hypothetical protein
MKAVEPRPSVVGDGVLMDLNQVTKRLTDLERWRYDEMEPWKSNVSVEIDNVKLESKEMASKMDLILNQIKKIQDSNWWVYVRDVMIISLVILMFIFIIIFSF